MLWLLKELRSGELIPVLYSAYSLLCIALALVLALMWVVPSWRPKLFANHWMMLLIGFGAMGAIKIVIFGVVDIYTWDTTVAFAIIGILTVAATVAILVMIALWVRDCLRGPQPLWRMVKDASLWGAVLGALLLIEFIEKRYKVPAFLIAMGILIPGVLVFALWDDRRRRKEWEAGAEQRATEHRLKVIEELSKDPDDAGALELYLKEHPK